MENLDSIECADDQVRLLPEQRRQRRNYRRNRMISDSEPTTLIRSRAMIEGEASQHDSRRNRTVSTAIRPVAEDPDSDLELTGCAGSCFCHPKSFCHRLIALVLMCLLGFGSYFCFDNPGALQVKNTVRNENGIVNMILLGCRKKSRKLCMSAHTSLPICMPGTRGQTSFCPLVGAISWTAFLA